MCEVRLYTFYFTYGTDPEYPFRGGWTEVYAPNLRTAIQLFKLLHPNREDSGSLNCSDYYNEEEFLSSKMRDKGNYGEYCHEAILFSHYIVEKEVKHE